MRKANLGDSTIIMFKDIYRYGKRMSRPNYWWGMLGLATILVLDFLALAVLPDIWFINVIILGVLLILLLAYLSATARRLRDVGYSGWFTFLSFIPYCVGLVILLFFTIKPTKKENNKYANDVQSNFGKFLTQSNKLFVGSLLAFALLFGIIGTTGTNDNNQQSTNSSTVNKHSTSSKYETNKNNDEKKIGVKGFYTVKIKDVKVNDDNNFVVQGTTKAPNNAKIIALFADKDLEETNNGVGVNEASAPNVETTKYARVKDGKFSAELGKRYLNSKIRANKQYKYYIVATNKNTDSKPGIFMDDSVAKSMKHTKIHKLKVTQDILNNPVSAKPNISPEQALYGLKGYKVKFINNYDTFSQNITKYFYQRISLTDDVVVNVEDSGNDTRIITVAVDGDTNKLLLVGVPTSAMSLTTLDKLSNGSKLSVSSTGLILGKREIDPYSGQRIPAIQAEAIDLRN